MQEKDLLGKAEQRLWLELEGDAAASLGRNGVERLKGKRVLGGEPLADLELLASFTEEEEMVLRAELEQAMVAGRRWVETSRRWVEEWPSAQKHEHSTH